MMDAFDLADQQRSFATALVVDDHPFLIRGGDSKAARTQLEQLAALGPKFEGQAEVAALMKTL